MGPCYILERVVDLFYQQREMDSICFLLIVIGWGYFTVCGATYRSVFIFNVSLVDLRWGKGEALFYASHSYILHTSSADDGEISYETVTRISGPKHSVDRKFLRI